MSLTVQGLIDEVSLSLPWAERMKFEEMGILVDREAYQDWTTPKIPTELPILPVQIKVNGEIYLASQFACAFFFSPRRIHIMPREKVVSDELYSHFCFHEAAHSWRLKEFGGFGEDYDLEEQTAEFCALYCSRLANEFQNPTWTIRYLKSFTSWTGGLSVTAGQIEDRLALLSPEINISKTTCQQPEHSIKYPKSYGPKQTRLHS